MVMDLILPPVVMPGGMVYNLLVMYPLEPFLGIFPCAEKLISLLPSTIRKELSLDQAPVYALKREILL